VQNESSDPKKGRGKAHKTKNQIEVAVHQALAKSNDSIKDCPCCKADRNDQNDILVWHQQGCIGLHTFGMQPVRLLKNAELQKVNGALHPLRFPTPQHLRKPCNFATREIHEHFAREMCIHPVPTPLADLGHLWLQHHRKNCWRHLGQVELSDTVIIDFSFLDLFDVFPCDEDQGNSRTTHSIHHGLVCAVVSMCLSVR